MTTTTMMVMMTRTHTHAQRRLEHGVAEELLQLFRIGPDLVHAHRARVLFDAGFKTHEDLAMVRDGGRGGDGRDKDGACPGFKLCLGSIP